MAQMMATNGATNGATNQTAKAIEIAKQFAVESWNKIQPKAVFSTRRRGLIREIAPPALLCLKEPAHGT